MNIRRALISILTIAVSAASFAVSAVGTWNGHIDLSKMKAMPGANPQQQEMVRKAMSSTKFVLVLKADHTYSTTMSGGMMKQPMTRGGTWTQSGNIVTTKSPRGTETMTVSANGKSMVAVPKQGNGVKIIFSR